MAPRQRDVFIVYSKSNLCEDALVDALVPRLKAVNIEAWTYGEWSWNHKVRRWTGRQEQFGRAK